MIIGVISDTHGILTQDAADALAGVRQIIHAGDIGSRDVIKALENIAPVTAVRGNMDSGSWTLKLPFTDLINLGPVSCYILHDLHTLDLDPLAADVKIVISGHTHKAESYIKNKVLFFNPGSASYGRYGGPLTVGRIEINNIKIIPEILKLSA
ncbi:MAG: metallophosphoesterase family protein [Desulfobacteraceae bacterium]|nr:metallophosphoesterase family protein [Desulfobacteraceae bacterium]